MWDVIMEKALPEKKLEKEVEKLRRFLQLSERRRLNQKVLYDKNLHNLHEKLADFEKTLLKEQKEVQARLQNKDQQIKVREDLAKALQNKFDNHYCAQCGYPSNKNKLDWQADLCIEKKAEYRKLPLLSLPLPENLPNVSFANRSLHCKSKLSPVAEESEVASSSYLRNIHADQNQDRFHAVLTASLECLQVHHVKKNITPESECDELNEVAQQKTNTHKLHLEEALEDDEERVRYRQPRPSINIQQGTGIEGQYDDDSDEYSSEELRECDDDEEMAEYDNAKADELPRSILDYANSLSLSILQIAYTNVGVCERVVPVENSRLPVENNCVPVDNARVPVDNTRVNCMTSFSNKVAFNIMSSMRTHMLNSDTTIHQSQSHMLHNDTTIHRSQSPYSSHKHPIDDCCEGKANHVDDVYVDVDDDVDGVCKPTFELVPSTVESDLMSESDNSRQTHIPIITNEHGDQHAFGEQIPYACDTAVCNGVSSNHILLPCEKHVCFEDASKEASTSDEACSYFDVSTLVVPLVDQAMEIAKNIVRRRSSTVNCTLDSSDEFEESLVEREEESVTNPSCNRKTLIELIDQAVENVIPNVNCCNDINSVNKQTNTSSPNNPLPSVNRCENNGGAVCKNNLPRSVEGGKCGKNSIPPDTNITENKENQSKSKKKKNKKKKKKKKSLVSDAGNRSAECEGKENLTILTTIMDCSEEVTFDLSEVVSSSLNNSQSEMNICYSALTSEEDKFSLTVDESFNEMEASRGSTPDTLDGFQ